MNFEEVEDNESKNWIRLPRAARLLGISRQAFYLRLKSNPIEILEVDTIKYVRKADVEKIKVRNPNRNKLRRD
mgnify:CR=1 FL=1